MRAEGHVVQTDERGGLSQGRVPAAAGAVIAYCQQRFRWIDGMPDEAVLATGRVPTDENLAAGNLSELVAPGIPPRRRTSSSR